MAPHVPGLLTRIIPATVIPRNTSSERRRAAAGRRLSPSPPSAAPAWTRAASSSVLTRASYSPTVMLMTVTSSRGLLRPGLDARAGCEKSGHGDGQASARGRVAEEDAHRGLLRHVLDAVRDHEGRRVGELPDEVRAAEGDDRDGFARGNEPAHELGLAL